MTRLALAALHRIGLVTCAASIIGCATVAARNEAVPLDETGKRSDDSHTRSGLVISGEELDTLASRYFGAVRITFENPSSHWVNVRTMRISFGSQQRNQAVLLPWGVQI